MAPAAPVTVIIATRDRVAELRRTLAILTALPESPAVIVVDNGSRDGTARAVRSEFPRVTVIRNRRNRKAAARNQGVRRAATRYVAFSDDDSWWEPGALARACDLLSRHPRVGVVAARTLVGASAADDPLNGVLAASPVRPAGPRAADVPGPLVFGFLGCAVVARREAFLDAGGYRPLLGIGGEEELLALDLAAAGRPAVYAEDVIARHFPSVNRKPRGRSAAQLRNRVLVAWLRRPLRRALGDTVALARQAGGDPVARRALAGLLLRLPLALATRRPVPPEVAAQLATLEPPCECPRHPCGHHPQQQGRTAAKIQNGFGLPRPPPLLPEAFRTGLPGSSSSTTRHPTAPRPPAQGSAPRRPACIRSRQRETPQSGTFHGDPESSRAIQDWHQGRAGSGEFARRTVARSLVW